MRNFNIDEQLISIIENLYKKAISEVIVNDTRGDLLRISVEVRQGCLLLSTLFSIFLEKNMQDILNYTSTRAVEGSHICNLRFADDIDLMAGSIDSRITTAHIQII